MKVSYFSKASEIGPSSRYRIFQYLPWFEASGFHVSVKPLFRSVYFHILEWRYGWQRIIGRAIYSAWRFMVRALNILSSLKADLIIVEGPLFPYAGVMVERWLAKRTTLIVELDDAIYLTPGQEKIIPALLKLSAGAIMGNETLATYARAFTHNVHVIPTVVDTTRFAPYEKGSALVTRSDADAVRIIWMGLDYNLPQLTWLIPVFKRLQAEHNIRIRVVCGKPPRIDGVEVECFRWQYDTEVDLLRTSDIGIMPLQDNEWTKGKCGLKLIQYMSVGLPAVASPIGVNCRILRDGVNGFLASTEDEWYAILSTLCRQTDLRERVGRAARRTVVDDYSLATWGPRLVACYRELSAHPKSLATPSA